MPSGNRTGPMGQGPRTGRSMGYCSGYDSPGFAKRIWGRTGGGRGRRFRGGAWGWHHYAGGMPEEPFYSRHYSPSREEEIQYLKLQSESFKRAQKDIEKRLNELEKNP